MFSFLQKIGLPRSKPNAQISPADSIQTNPAGYDIIGDLHGHASSLRALLTILGYIESSGVWKHPAKIAIFVGDFIDRGPAIPETLAIVRNMVVSGSAHAVMGNHELDALRFDFDPQSNSHLKSQLEATHMQFKGRDSEWQHYLEWFRTLPMTLDLGAFRVVHACWNNAAAKLVSTLSCPLSDEALHLLNNPKTREGSAAQTLLNGVRLVLPGDLFVRTLSGLPLNWMRAKWWIPMRGQRYDDVAFPDLDMVPMAPIVLPQNAESSNGDLYDGYPLSAAPVFFGHYSLPRNSLPRPLATNVVCLDYSVWKGGPLVAYRWTGEQEPSSDKFVSS